jgi:hypothetical protein
MWLFVLSLYLVFTGLLAAAMIGLFLRRQAQRLAKEAKPKPIHRR